MLVVLAGDTSFSNGKDQLLAIVGEFHDLLRSTINDPDMLFRIVGILGDLMQ